MIFLLNKINPFDIFDPLPALCGTCHLSKSCSKFHGKNNGIGQITAENRWKNGIFNRIRTLKAPKLMKKRQKYFMATGGIDLETSCMQKECSTTALQGHLNNGDQNL